MSMPPARPEGQFAKWVTVATHSGYGLIWLVLVLVSLVVLVTGASVLWGLAGVALFGLLAASSIRSAYRRVSRP